MLNQCFKFFCLIFKSYSYKFKFKFYFIFKSFLIIILSVYCLQSSVSPNARQSAFNPTKSAAHIYSLSGLFSEGGSRRK